MSQTQWRNTEVPSRLQSRVTCLQTRLFSQVSKALDEDDIITHVGPLDQGSWPDGLLAPPAEEAGRQGMSLELNLKKISPWTPPLTRLVRWDLEKVKEMGCKMVRKHIKIEVRSTSGDTG